MTRLWQFLATNPVLAFVIVLLILAAGAAAVSIAYGIWLQRTLKGKGRHKRHKDN